MFVIASLVIAVLLTLAACERVGASSVTPEERNGMALWPTSNSADTSPSADASAGPSLLDDHSDEPTDSIDASAAPAPDEPRMHTLATRPPWAGDFDKIVNGVNTKEKVVALTFDAGPTAHTRQIIGELDAAHAHATFFWVGSRITTDVAIYAVAHREELANHTWSHPNMRRLTSMEASEQIGFTNARIAAITGFTPVWFRSPFNRLYLPELQQIRAHGLLYANYDVTSVDWMKSMSRADVLLKIDETLRPGGVILMHDSPGHAPKYVPDVLRLLHRRGYQVVTMSALAQMGKPVNEPLRLGVGGLGY